MGPEYPDILNDLVDAKQRWEVDGVQYVATLEPSTTAPGSHTTLSLYLQSAVDAPLNFQVTLDLPKRPTGFTVADPKATTALQPGQVGVLNIPIRVTAETPPGTYTFRLDLDGKATTRAHRIRSPQSRGRWPNTPIKDTVGLEIAPVVGVGYSSRMNARPAIKITVAGKAESTEEVDLTPAFNAIWNIEDLDLQARAAKELNERRPYVVPPLTRPIVYAAMLNETRGRFADCGVELQMGEAIYIAKILTRTTEMFLSNDTLQDALFVPIFRRLLLHNVPFDNSIWLLMKIGYDHLLNLALALSFGLLEDYRRHRIWPLEEQRAARRFITQQILQKGELPIDLVYVPLIFGGILVGDQITLEGENPSAGLDSLIRAKNSRLNELSREDDQVVSVLNELLLAKTA